ncbi:hypothetical protein ACQX16_12195, partial [Corynebacterium diphtheriae]
LRRRWLMPGPVPKRSDQRRRRNKDTTGLHIVKDTQPRGRSSLGLRLVPVMVSASCSATGSAATTLTTGYIDGVLDGWASEFIKTIDEPIIYAERSISGEGLHIFIKTDERAGRKLRFMGKIVEAYTRQRFIRTTLNTAKEAMAYARSGA